MKSNHNNPSNQHYTSTSDRPTFRFGTAPQATWCTEAQVNGYAKHLASELSYRCEAE
jgi:hypothetical protein